MAKATLTAPRTVPCTIELTSDEAVALHEWLTSNKDSILTISWLVWALLDDLITDGDHETERRM